MTAFGEIFNVIMSHFGDVFDWMDQVKLVGPFSVLDIVIVAIILDVIITGLFVTFNVGFSESESDTVSNGSSAYSGGRGGRGGVRSYDSQRTSDTRGHSRSFRVGYRR